MVETYPQKDDLTPATCRAGRALLDWTQNDLANAAGICRSTVREFEKGHHDLQRGSAEALISALLRGGVVLLCHKTEGPGVKLKPVGNPEVGKLGVGTPGE